MDRGERIQLWLTIVCLWLCTFMDGCSDDKLKERVKALEEKAKVEHAVPSH